MRKKKSRQQLTAGIPASYLGVIFSAVCVDERKKKQYSSISIFRVG